MSGKPASVGVPGAPRVLVYVEPRPLAPGAAPLHAPRALCLPAAAPLYRPDRRALPSALYYKSATEADNTASRSDFYQPYVKEAVLKTEDCAPDERSGLDVKRDGVDEIGPEYSSAEAFLSGVPPDAEPGSYSVRCTGPPEGALLRHAQNQYSESVTVHSADIADRDSAGKSFVNYQFLEQSVSHQSIVNQSISILNQQVGVSRGVVSEEDGGSSPQLVRTADGVVLAVVTAPVGPSPVEPPDNRTVLSESQQTITVPLGWRRIITGTSVLYISPSGTALSTLPQLREYLQTAGTCKCGLPCPLRPETAFSFDSKVVSKPYQVASGAELTKLCNHKRKLLASLQARGQSPATPPPLNTDQKKASGTEVALLKKKMKKRPGFPANVSISQLMVQRERPLAEFKSQEELTQPTMGHSRPTAGCLPSYPTQQTPQHAAINPADVDPKQDTQVQRSNHYLTVNNGWITQHTVEAQKPAPSVLAPGNSTHPPVGVPVRGANGQIIGVNTCYKYNYRGPLPTEPERKDERKEPAAQHSAERMAVDGKGEESQIFCGLNQALTPEVMRKINEQQQIFIQQNQKQIEMARYRSQLAENANQSKMQGRFAQAQSIQNGALVKTNPAKTPPWQVKRTEGDAVAMTSPNPKLPKPENVDYDESNATMSEDSSSSFSSFSSNEQATQGMCPRVPPLPQHYNTMGQQWPPAETIKRKGKSTKGKKKNSPTENKIINFGMRPAQDQKGNTDRTDIVPSFMDDPSGYLAQQTALLNNTISRQVGATSGYDGTRFDGTNGSNFIQQQQHRLTPNEMPIYRNDALNASPSPNTTPDSSVVSDKVADASCCKGCNPTSEGVSPDYADRRLGYLKHNMYKMELGDQTGLKRGFDDSPVTSSTFIERSHSGENCSPIQAGTVSTSNVSHTETLQPPEPSPTSSNSSRSADTPHSHSNGNNAVQSNGAYLSPAYANNCRDGYNASAGAPVYHYNSPGPPSTQAATGTQMMHFISNHNVNKNLMEVDNISMVGVKPAVKAPEGTSEPRRRIENSMPGYCPPPHMGGGPAHSLIQACYIQTFVTTMASGFSVTRDTVTSVLAGRANTATTSINASRANFIRPPPPPSVDLATTYAIPNNQPDPFLNSVNLPTSYPLHIAGTTAQNMISKSPLEMVQNVIGNIPPRSEPSPTAHHHPGKRATPGQILISSTGQIIVSSERMPPPPPKVSCGAGAGEVALAPPAVMVSSLPAPYVLQPPMMSVEGQVVTAPPADASRQIDIKTHHAYVQGVAMLSPENSKKRSKKKKSPTSVTNVLQITAPQQNASNIMVHSSPQHNTSPQFSPRGFQLSPSGNMSPTPMLQALTIVPGKSGTPAHIVMNGQSGANGFGSQQIIANASPSQQINLLQPVNLINNTGGVVSNFPFQQFIVPNLGGMVMTADGTAIIQDNSTGMPMQLQLQTVNGQSVLTPVQSQGMFAATGGNGGVVLRAQNHQGKMIQSQHSPGAQFLSPNHQVVVNGPGFNGQLSPLLANLSPTNVTFGGQQVRSGNVQTQEFIQTNRMGQALMVPLSPKRQLTNNRANSTFVQNTTIVQQQTTLVSNGQMSGVAAGVPPSARLSIDPSALLGKTSPPKPRYEEEAKKAEKAESREYAKLLGELNACEFVRHSVSTQTRARTSPARLGGSPPDTTTHSPLGAEPEYAAECRRAHTLADTTTSSPEPPDANSSAMVQCVSSSEQDMADSREHAWPAPSNDFTADSDGQNMMSMQMMRQRPHNPVESSEILYNQAVGVPQSHNQHVMPMASNYYDRNQAYKRKNDFGDGSTYRSDKIMRTNTYNIVHTPKDNDYDLGMVADKNQRHYQPSGSSSDPLQKVFDRHHLGSSDDGEGEPGEVVEEGNEGRGRKFEVGELVWGPVKGYSSWPGKLRARAADGRWTVHWFGADKPPCDVTSARLLTLSEGLEAHHAARTKHRKSRKLNTLLENAIQEAMSELDKKSDPSSSEAGPSTEPAEVEPIADTPRRKKLDKLKTKDKHHKKTPVRIAPNPHKPADGARLRSAR